MNYVNFENHIGVTCHANSTVLINRHLYIVKPNTTAIIVGVCGCTFCRSRALGRDRAIAAIDAYRCDCAEASWSTTEQHIKTLFLVNVCSWPGRVTDITHRSWLQRCPAVTSVTVWTSRGRGDMSQRKLLRAHFQMFLSKCLEHIQLIWTIL